MSGIFGRKTFPGEDMSQMRITRIAAYFYPSAVRIRNLFYGAGKMVVKGGPTTAGIKFSPGCVKRGITSAANVGSFLKKGIVLAAKWRLRAAVYDNVRFFVG